MRPPTLMTPSSNMGRSFTILLERLTWPFVFKSCISSAYTSLCTNLTMVNVAFSKSAVVRFFSISAFLSLRYCRYALNFSSQAIFRCSTVQEEYFTSNSVNFSGRVRVNIALSSFISWSSSGRASISKHGQSSSGFIRKAGPLNHLSLVNNRCARMPRDASSAGLRLPDNVSTDRAERHL